MNPFPFAAGWNETPLKKCCLAFRPALKDSQDALTWSDVVAGKQRWKIRMINAIELYSSRVISV